MDIIEFNEFMATSNRRARSGRRAARWMIASALAVIGTAAFLFIAAPSSMGGSFLPTLLGFPIPAIGIVGIAIGLGWMIRILRANPEPDANAWRYRGR